MMHGLANLKFYVTIDIAWSKSLLDVRNKRGADIGSDHHMIMRILRIKTQKVIRKTIYGRRYNLKRLEDTECQKTLKLSYEKGLPL